MTEPFDPFELLREINPVDPTDLEDAATSPEARETLTQILSGTHAPSKSRWRVRRLHFPRRQLALSAVLTLASFAAGLLVWILVPSSSRELSVRCYANARLSARAVTVRVGGNKSTVVACQQIWQRRAFGGTSAPHLQACMLPNEVIGVFPTSVEDQVCERLHLAPLTPKNR
jgi:hypothetical protein